MGNRAGSSPVARTNIKGEAFASPLIFYEVRKDVNPSKCGAGGRRRLQLDAAEPLFSAMRQKMKSSPVARTKALKARAFGATSSLFPFH